MTEARRLISILAVQVIEAKEDRTALHKALREAFPDQLSSEAAPQNDGKQAIKIEWAKPGGQQRGNRGK